jgi:hypothetical protein
VPHGHSDQGKTVGKVRGRDCYAPERKPGSVPPDLKGAINMLIDISEEQAETLKEQAARCRRLANSTEDLAAREILRSMAAGYDRSAQSLQHD